MRARERGGGKRKGIEMIELNVRRKLEINCFEAVLLYK